MMQQQTYFLELYRASMRTATEIMKASLENTQRVLEESTKSAQQLSEVKSLDEMMALQTRLTGAQLERAADMWGKLWRAASDGQMAMIGQVQNQVGQMSDRVRETYQGAASTAQRTAERAADDASRFAVQQDSRKQHQERKSA
jgi:hypothetical protein